MNFNELREGVPKIAFIIRENCSPILRVRGYRGFAALSGEDGLVAVEWHFVVLGPTDRAALARPAHELQRRDAPQMF